MHNKILLLTDVFEKNLTIYPHSKDEKILHQEEWETEFDVITALRSMGYSVNIFGLYKGLDELKQKITEEKPKCIFNLCESYQADRSLESHVVSFLELQSIPFTGASSFSLQLCKNKALTKVLLLNSGHQVPIFSHFQKNDSKNIISAKWEKISHVKKWIVKPLNLESSEGINLSSVVNTKEQAFKRMAQLFEKLSDQVIIEEFIEGKELYVSVLSLKNNRHFAFGPRELIFPNYFSQNSRIATYRTKWDEHFKKQKGIYSSAFSIDDQWNAKALKASSSIASVLGLTGYCRFDFRLHPERGLFFLEANPNPGLAQDDEFALAIMESAGITYSELVDSLVLQALQKKRCFDFANRKRVQSL